MSVDPAHILADSFDLEASLFHEKTNQPYPILARLSIQEGEIQNEIKRHWREISTYVVSVLGTTGISDVEAEELAILSGLKSVPPRPEVRPHGAGLRATVESMRFVSMPTTLEW